MKIKLVTQLSGPDGSYPPGTELDTDQGEISKKAARDLVDGNYAIELKQKRNEAATVAVPENTALTPSAEEMARENLQRIAEAEAAAKQEAEINARKDEIAGLESQLQLATDAEEKTRIQTELQAKREELALITGVAEADGEGQAGSDANKGLLGRLFGVVTGS